MKKLYTYVLKNGEVISFNTNMPKKYIKDLPTFSNQHKCNSYFKSSGFNLEIDIITKTLWLKSCFRKDFCYSTNQAV